MNEQLWDNIEALYKGERARKGMTGFEKKFIDGLYKKGHRGHLSSKQAKVLQDITAKLSPDPGIIRIDYEHAVAQLAQARTTEDLLARTHDVLALRCKLLDRLPDASASVCSHNLAEALVATFRKNLPTE